MQPLHFSIKPLCVPAFSAGGYKKPPRLCISAGGYKNLRASASQRADIKNLRVSASQREDIKNLRVSASQREDIKNLRASASQRADIKNLCASASQRADIKNLRVSASQREDIKNCPRLCISAGGTSHSYLRGYLSLLKCDFSHIPLKIHFLNHPKMHILHTHKRPGYCDCLWRSRGITKKNHLNTHIYLNQTGYLCHA